MKAKRFLYLGYYFRQLDREKTMQFVRYAQQQTGYSKLKIIRDAILSSLRYNIGLIDYFYFRFYEKNATERSKWVGTGYKYEYDLIMNPTDKRHILQNKIHFFKAYQPFIQHGMCLIEDLEENNKAAQAVLNNASGKIAIKDALGQCGWNVEVKRADEMSREDLIPYMRSRGFNMVEEFIVQHPDLNRISPSGLNTVRIITQLNAKGGVDFIGPTLRMTVNSAVDNMAMGNIAAPIDLETGKIKGKGVYQDITREPVAQHPVTGVKLIGYQIPYWKEVLELCTEAALYNTNNKSIGWDVAIRASGPSFLEGNHNWCKLLWQLPIGHGMKHVLRTYLESPPKIEQAQDLQI